MRLPARSRRKPGMLRVADGRRRQSRSKSGPLSPENFGRFVSAIPGHCRSVRSALSDGRQVQGFLVEPEAVKGARDISEFGGWRTFVKSAKAAAQSSIAWRSINRSHSDCT